jgi:tRNA-specific adenosine deaminase 1
MDIPGDDIAEVVLQQFNALPSKRKPLARGDGVREWVPLSGIVAQGGPWTAKTPWTTTRLTAWM